LVTGARTVTITSGNTSWGVIVALRAASAAYELATSNGIDATANTSFTAAMNVGPGMAVGDMAVIAGSIPTDVGRARSSPSRP
jgi:hypothetical protein